MDDPPPDSPARDAPVPATGRSYNERRDCDTDAKHDRSEELTGRNHPVAGADEPPLAVLLLPDVGVYLVRLDLALGGEALQRVAAAPAEDELAPEHRGGRGGHRHVHVPDEHPHPLAPED